MSHLYSLLIFKAILQNIALSKLITIHAFISIMFRQHFVHVT